MGEIIINHDYIAGVIDDDYSKYLKELQDAREYITTSALSTSQEDVIKRLTSQLQEYYSNLFTPSNSLGNIWKDYLDKIELVEKKLCELKTDEHSVKEYNEQIPRIVDNSVAPVLKGEKRSLQYWRGKDFDYEMYKRYCDILKGAWSNYSDAYTDTDGHNCTDTCWRKLKDNAGIWLPFSSDAKNWDNRWRELGGYTYDISIDENGNYVNFDKIRGNDIMCFEEYQGAGDAGHVIYVGTDENGKFYLAHSGKNMGYHETNKYDSLVDLLNDSTMSKELLVDVEHIKDQLKNGKVSILSMDGPIDSDAV